MKGKSTAKVYESDEAEYRAEHDLHTLIEAKKIEGDKDRLKAAMKCAERKRADMKKAIDGIK